MLKPPLTDPILIRRENALERLVSQLQQEPILAVDTESNSMYVYYEQVCLVQFSTPSADFLVDPLALDLGPLAPIFANPNIEKVFHAAEYDLICLKRDYGFEFKNLFDTMLAARILGRTEVGLGTLLEKEFGVVLDKRFQRANWGQRPLPPDQLAYAQLDTHYLLALQMRLKEELKQQRRWELAQEDFNRLVQINSKRPENNHSNENGQAACWKINGANDLEPQHAAVLLELCRVRDQIGRASNRPVFKIFQDHTLLAIAAALPGNLQELARIQGMNPRQVRRYGQEILLAVEQGLKAPPAHPPRHVRPDEDYLERLDGLRNWRKAAGQRNGVGSDVILPRDLMLSLAMCNPKDPQALAQVLDNSPWRLKQYGDEILQVLRMRGN